MANSVRLLYSPPANVFLRVARGAGSAALRAFPLGSPYSPLMVIAGWEARTQSLSEPLSPRGPQPVLTRLRGVGVRHFAQPQQGPWTPGVGSH